jgi:hypothetical protein
MDNEEKFKKTLNSILESKEFPFDEQEWEKAKQLIDEGKRRRRLFPFFIIGLLLLTGGLSYFALMSRTEDLLSQKNIHSISEEQIQTATASEPLAQNTASEPESIKGQNAGRTRSQRAPEINLSADQKQRSPHDQKDRSAEKVVTQKEIKLANIDAGTATQAEDTTPGSPVSGKETQSTSAPENAAKQPASEITSVSIGGNEEKHSDPLASNDNTKKTEAPAEAPLPIQQETLSTSVVSESAQQPAVTESPVATVTGTISVTEPQQAAPVTSSAATSSVVTVAQVPDTAKRVKELMLSYEAGGSFNAGWKNPGGTDAQGITPVFGVNYFTSVAPKIYISLGLQYNSVSKLAYSSMTSKVTKYTMGEESKVTVITPSKLHYLTIPLRLHYSVNGKHTVGAGYNIAYLFNVEANVNTYTSKLNRREDEKNYTTGGYTEGFSVFDPQLALFYRYNFYKNLSVNAEIFFGLKDVKADGFFGTSVYERNKGLKLSLVYNIYRNR